MIAEITYNSEKYTIDLSNPLDISIAIDTTKENVNAWYIDDPEIIPEQFDGNSVEVAKGAPVNFNSIHFNPHSHITHTECVGHITAQVHSINQNLKNYFFLTNVITIEPEEIGEDKIITKKQLQDVLGNKAHEALVIRTVPNTSDKKSRKYSNTNPPYLDAKGANYLKQIGIKHLLIDLPSIDKERDEGKLASHNTFWNTEGDLRLDATITEFIYVPNTIKDGVYFLNLMVAPFENDATPSKPILYDVQKK